MAQVVAGRATHQLLLGSLAPMIRAIGSSLGPNGRVALFDIGGRVGRATSGVAIAREISADGLQGVAQTIFREVLVSADRDLGDGTARLALIAEASFRAGAAYASDSISAGKLAGAFASIRKEIADMIANEQCADCDMEDVAITAGADPFYARSLAAAFRDAGPSGCVELTPSRERGIVTELFSGFVFDPHTICPAMPSGEPLSLNDVHIIAADDIISDFGTLAPVIEGFASKRKSLLIVAREVGGSALAALERNSKAGILSVVALKPEDAGPRAAAIIEDLAVATGAALVSERSGLSFSSIKPTMLGRASLLRVSAGRAELRGLARNPADIEARAALIEDDIRRSRYLSLDREHAERRRARLLGRWAEIRVGGETAFEIDALVATGKNALACMRSAAGYGVIRGGGGTLSRIAGRIEAQGCGDAAAAGKVAAKGLRSIERQLLHNAEPDRDLSDFRGGHATPGRLTERPAYDPLRLTQLLVDQALSLTTHLLRIDAAVVR
jgi:chaperonin GroEL